MPIEKSANTEFEERLHFVEQFLAQKSIITNSDLCSIHAYLRHKDRGKTDATNSAV